jgi:hypothetical protein
LEEKEFVLAVIERLSANNLQLILVQYGDNCAKNKGHRGRDGDSLYALSQEMIFSDNIHAGSECVSSPHTT